MNTHSKVGIGAAGAGILTVVVMVVGLPVLVVTGAGSSGVPLAGGALNATGIPPVVAEAYQRAAAQAPTFDPPCEVPPWLLAGVGEIETGHGTHGGGSADLSGDVSPPIVGPALPGLGGDTDGGDWDSDIAVDHAVGPMQFIPSTWRAYGLDGNIDGAIDPHNVFDAALTAAAYLCAAGSPMASEADWRRGLYAYNHSDSYVQEVLDAAASYRPTGPAGGDGSLDDAALVDVPGIGLTSSRWAGQVSNLLAAAASDGVQLGGSSYRDPAEQIALRQAHCGTSTYAIYEMPSSQCSPPTARPGTSNHEQGLAIDFDRCGSRTTSCYRWLSIHADDYGIHNLPSEPWHWSVDGR